MELTSEDKQRIYKEVNRIFNESESVDLVHELMFKVGEYEHKYQREQQKKLSNKRKPWDDENNNLIKELGRRDGKVQQLEAERSELQAWKESEMKLWGPILDYAQTHPEALGLTAGDSISKKVLEILKERSDLVKLIGDFWESYRQFNAIPDELENRILNSLKK